MPVASVIMPCYNAEKFARQAVESILLQSVGDFELIVVDDASRDASAKVLRELANQDARIRLLTHEKNRGASRSRNDGLRLARGDYVAFCDADDMWKPDKLEIQIGQLSRHPSYHITYCESQIIDEAGALTGRVFSDQYPPPGEPSGNLFEELCARNFINMQTVCLRREAIGQELFFDESIKWVEDWWQWVRLSRHHLFLYDNRPLALYRIHSQSTGFTQHRGIWANRWRVCRRNLRAHRDLPVQLQALLWYYMGTSLSLLGRRRLARRFFWHATCLGWNQGRSVGSIVRMGARWGVECCQGLARNRQNASS